MTLRLSCCDLEWQFREKLMTYLKSAPSNQVYLMCHINIEKSPIYRVSQGFCMTYRVTLRKKPPMDDFKNGQNTSSIMCRRYFKRNLGWWRPIDSILIQAQFVLYLILESIPVNINGKCKKTDGVGQDGLQLDFCIMHKYAMKAEKICVKLARKVTEQSNTRIQLIHPFIQGNPPEQGYNSCDVSNIGLHILCVCDT